MRLILEECHISFRIFIKNIRENEKAGIIDNTKPRDTDPCQYTKHNKVTVERLQ